MSTPKQFAWCIKCGKSFSTKRGFKNHVKSHTNKDKTIEKPGRNK